MPFNEVLQTFGHSHLLTICKRPLKHIQQITGKLSKIFC